MLIWKVRTSYKSNRLTFQVREIGAVPVVRSNIMKYNEDKIVKEILDYIKSTYGQHYSTGQDGFQVQDLFKTLNIGKDFCHANAIKYLCRYGKKNGYNRADLLKAAHYVILLLNYDKENVK